MNEQCDYTFECGSGDNRGITPTGVVSRLFEEEMLAKLSLSAFLALYSQHVLIMHLQRWV